MTKEKFKTALVMFADLDAIHDSRDMDFIVDFLYDAVNDAKPEAKLDNMQNEASKSVYIVMTFADDKPIALDRIFNDFDLAKEYIVEELENYIRDLRHDCEYDTADKLEKKVNEFRFCATEDWFTDNLFEWMSKVENGDFYMYMTRVTMNEATDIEF